MNFMKNAHIGSGGFGEVWSATRVTDGAEVAVKYLVDRDQVSEDRFRREVRCLETLSHPNVVKVLGKELGDGVGELYYVMPLYSASLFHRMPSVTGDFARIKNIFTSICDGMSYAHAEGVIHRDLKPENVLLNSDTDIAVTDFGLGRILTSASTRLTNTGQGFGTLLYCAPEQLADAKRADARSDIYSLGRILYDLFYGIDLGPIDLDAVPYPIAAVIKKASHRDPANRYQTVSELLLDFSATMGLLLGDLEPDSIEDLLEKLKSPLEFSSNLDKLAMALKKQADNGDVVHSALMTIPDGVFSALEKSQPDLARHLVGTFFNYVTSQSWGFSYTDTIASVCGRLFYESGDPIVRARLTEAVLVVGVSHNRWAVMEKFGSMVHSIKSEEDAQQHWVVLRHHLDELRAVSGYINRSRLIPALANLFPSEVPEQ
ncbi:Serine/threonine protein kinase [Bryocella elongata]|uniref:Serine/threonine protein kinase n=1 Tax=Bryocella elongata TaxID=863522 RepID=A0A1H5XML5_9BACT|nr:serine/threonine-protein kinase [Bryocella elongata]SEG13001.1 Serine/threonine protein kinase [Bryocella elongata]